MGLGTYALVLITCPSYEEGERIAKLLTDERLAACVNVVRGVKSFFWWEGKVETSDEVLLLIKTRLDLLERLVERVRKAHSYQVPEIVAIPIVYGYREYLKWIDGSVVA